MNQWLTGAINKLWGTSSSDLYAVGNNGLIAHYDGSSWRRIESPAFGGTGGTELDVRDIWGAIDNRTGEKQILAIACNDGVDRKLIEIKDKRANLLPDSGLSKFVYSIWFVPNRQYYIIGAGIHYKHSLAESIWKRYEAGVITRYESCEVFGNDINDVFVSGSFLEIVHFNGSTWYNYQNEIPHRYAAVGVKMRNNVVIMVGLEGSRAIAIVGKR